MLSFDGGRKQGFHQSFRASTSFGRGGLTKSSRARCCVPWCHLNGRSAACRMGKRPVDQISRPRFRRADRIHLTCPNANPCEGRAQKRAHNCRPAHHVPCKDAGSGAAGRQGVARGAGLCVRHSSRGEEMLPEHQYLPDPVGAEIAGAMPCRLAAILPRARSSRSGSPLSAGVRKGGEDRPAFPQRSTL